MEEEPLNELFVLKQNENVEIDCLQALALGHSAKLQELRMSLSALRLPNFRYHINNSTDQRRRIIEDIPANRLFL